MKNRLDIELSKRGLVATRSQAESWIKLGKVFVDGMQITKPGHKVSEDAIIKLNIKEQFVSRAGLKLASVAEKLKLDFKDKIVLDVGSSTGGFTDYALGRGAKKVIAVDVGTDQMHPSLRNLETIELHEKTDIRDFKTDQTIDLIVGDVSFISLREILPSISQNLMSNQTLMAIMVKPQFEAGKGQLGSSGVVKNDSVRRQILKDFEAWSKQYFVILGKADSEVSGATGNKERFYLAKKIK